MRKNRAKKILPFQTGTLLPLSYVENGPTSLPTRVIIIVGSCYSWGYYIGFSAIVLLFYLPLAKLPELAKIEYLLTFQLIRMGSASFHAKYDFAVFQKPLPLLLEFNTNHCPYHWFEITLWHSLHGTPCLLLFISNLWTPLLPLIMSLWLHISSLYYSHL